VRLRGHNKLKPQPIWYFTEDDVEDSINEKPPKFYEEIINEIPERLADFKLQQASRDNAYMALVGSVDGSFDADIVGEHRNYDNKLVGVQIKPNIYQPEQSSLNKFLIVFN